MNKSFAKPSHFDQLYPGRFLKSGELLGKKVTVKIADIQIDELEGEKGKKIQGIIFLEGKDKQIVLNKTNGLCLRGMFGAKLTEWVGKRITIFQDQTKLAGELVDCIRIWGSPDIAEDKNVTINLPRKKPFTMTMHKVDRAGGSTDEPTHPASDAPKDN